LTFYQRHDLSVQAILTDNGREFCGTERHPYELYLALNGIAHRKTRVGSPRTNGFVVRFNGTVLKEFFRPNMSAGCMRASKRCRPISTPGWTTTTTRARTSATATRAAARGKPSSCFVSQSSARKGG
jgi:transposase InsO family protein